MKPTFLLQFLTLLWMSHQCHHCLHVLSSQCVICYSICHQLTFLNCTQSQCQDSFVDANGTTQCNQTTNQNYPQKTCLMECCGDNQDQAFSMGTLNRCRKVIVPENHDSTLIIVGISAFVGILIFIYLLRWGMRKCSQKTEEDQDKKKKSEDEEDEEKSRCEKLMSSLYENVPCCCGCLKNKYQDSSEKKIEPDLVKKNKKISKYGRWKKHDYLFQNIQAKCGVCFMDKPNSMASCGDPVHLMCIIEYIKYSPVCPTCSIKNFNPIKFFCGACSSRYFEVHINFFSSEEQIMRKISGPKCPNCS